MSSSLSRREFLSDEPADGVRVWHQAPFLGGLGRLTARAFRSGGRKSTAGGVTGQDGLGSTPGPGDPYTPRRAYRAVTGSESLELPPHPSSRVPISEAIAASAQGHAVGGIVRAALVKRDDVVSAQSFRRSALHAAMSVALLHLASEALVRCVISTSRARALAPASRHLELVVVSRASTRASRYELRAARLKAGREDSSSCHDPPPGTGRACLASSRAPACHKEEGQTGRSGSPPRHQRGEVMRSPRARDQRSSRAKPGAQSSGTA